MRNTKPLVVIGGILIVIGIVLKAFKVDGIIPILCFAFGGGLKSMYLYLGVKSGRFVIGRELVLLIVGVLLVIGAVVVRKLPEILMFSSVWLLVTGLLLKALFIVLFVKRQKVMK